MKVIKRDIEEGNLQQIYLLTGTEDYLKTQFRDRLIQAICPDDQGLNISRFGGKGIDFDEIAEIAETMPFFAPYRVIVIERGGVMKKAYPKLIGIIESLPETTKLIIVEDEADKRLKQYGLIKKKGYIAELKAPDSKSLYVWIAEQCKKEGKRIQQDACIYLADYTRGNMNMILMELEKIIAYCYDQDIITLEAVTTMCSTTDEDHMFEMLSAIGSGNLNRAMDLYQELLALQIIPTKILYHFTKMVGDLMKMKPMVNRGMSNDAICKGLGIFYSKVKAYRDVCARFNQEELRSLYEACVDTDMRIKRGYIQGNIGLELMIADFVTKKNSRT